MYTDIYIVTVGNECIIKFSHNALPWTSWNYNSSLHSRTHIQSVKKKFSDLEGM